MSEHRSRWAMVFKPEGVEQELPASVRLRFAMLGANRLHAVTAESQPELQGLLEGVSEKTGMPAPQAYIWESKKPVANAVAIPGRVPTIAFSKNITELLNPEELSAVAAHELGHVKNMNQSGKIFWLSAIGGGALAHIAAKPIQQRIAGQFLRGKGNPALMAASMAVEAGTFIAPLAAGAVASRSEELAADRHAAFALEGNAVPLVSALEKLNEFNGTPKTGSVNPIRRALSSHPSYEQRRIALGVSEENVAGYQAMEESAAEGANPRRFTDTISSKSATADWQERVNASAEAQDNGPRR